MSTAEGTREYYDRNAEAYDAKTGFGLESGQAYNFHRYYEPFLRGAVPSAGRILEIGCGTGFYSRWLAERGLDVVAMDISTRMLEQAKQRCPTGVAFFAGDCQDPAPSLGAATVGDGFDAIVGINTFSYYPNKREALTHYRRILREGGKLILLDMNGTSYTQWLAYTLNYRGARRFARNVSQSTPRKLRSMLTALISVPVNSEAR